MFNRDSMLTLKSLALQWTAIAGLAALSPLPTHAESTAGAWQWSTTLYAWLPSLGGETSFPTSGGGPSIDVDADAILDSLNFTFMAALEARKGAWALASDLIYLDLGATETGTRDFGIGQLDLPASIDADLKLDITGWLWTMAGSYTLVSRQGLSVDVLAGARMLDLEQDLRWRLNGDIASLPLPGRSGASRVQETQWDAIVGVKGRATLGTGSNWYVPYYLDVGTGDSDVTWQGMVGLGCNFGSFDVIGAWRYLDYDFGGNSPIASLDFNGPALGIKFRF